MLLNALASSLRLGSVNDVTSPAEAPRKSAALGKDRFDRSSMAGYLDLIWREFTTPQALSVAHLWAARVGRMHRSPRR